MDHEWIDFPFRVACRGQCDDRTMDELDSLASATKAGWVDIVCDEKQEYSPITHWWTHVGTCPRCQELEQVMAAATAA